MRTEPINPPNLIIETVSFHYLFPSDNPDEYEYTSWICLRWPATPYTNVQFGAATRVAIPKRMTNALHLYKTLLGKDWEDTSRWPVWMLEECKEAGMYMDCMDSFTVNKIMRSMTATLIDTSR